MPEPFTTTTGSFVPTTNIFDSRGLETVEIPSDEFRQILVRLYQDFNRVCLVLNTKDTGYYDTQAFVNGQLYFQNPATYQGNSSAPPFRPVTRVVINFGTLPDSTTISIPHNIPVNSSTIFTRIYGTATEPSTSFIPIPYVDSAGVNTVQLRVSSKNVNITTISDMSDYTICYVVLEYLTF